MTRLRQHGNTRTNRYGLAVFFAATLLALPIATMAKTALIATPLGNIEIELLEADAPKTVANFMAYIESGKYDNSFVHRNEAGFVIQGGGFTFSEAGAASIIPFAPIENETKISNTRGTVSMARSSDPDSATSHWFINLTDNSFLDHNYPNPEDGYTVFAKVIGNGMDVVDAINKLKTLNVSSTFPTLPVINHTTGSPILQENLVMTQVSEKLATPVQSPSNFVMNAGLNDAWYNPLTDGQGFFITVFPDLGLVNLAWFTYDTDLPVEGETAGLGDAGHRWLTALGSIEGNTAALEIEVASGGLFDTVTDVVRTSDGTITLTFSDCNTGLVEYNIPSIDRQGSVPIQRIANDNIALCEALRQ